MFCVWKVSSGLPWPTFFRSRFPAKCFAQTKDMRACVVIMVPNPKQLACLESNNLDQFGSSKLYLTLNIPNQCLSNCHPWHIIIVIAANLVPWELILRLRRIWCGVDETTSAPSRVSQVMVGHPPARHCFNGWYLVVRSRAIWLKNGSSDMGLKMFLFLCVAQTCYLWVVGCCIDFFVTGAFPSLDFRVSAMKCVEMSMWFCIFRTGPSSFLIVDPIWSKNQV